MSSIDIIDAIDVLIVGASSDSIISSLDSSDSEVEAEVTQVVQQQQQQQQQQQEEEEEEGEEDLAERYGGSSSEIAPLLSKNDLKYMCASCDVCWIFPLYEYLTSTKYTRRHLKNTRHMKQ